MMISASATLLMKVKRFYQISTKKILCGCKEEHNHNIESTAHGYCAVRHPIGRPQYQNLPNCLFFKNFCSASTFPNAFAVFFTARIHDLSLRNVENVSSGLPGERSRQEGKDLELVLYHSIATFELVRLVSSW